MRPIKFRAYSKKRNEFSEPFTFKDIKAQVLYPDDENIKICAIKFKDGEMVDISDDDLEFVNNGVVLEQGKLKGHKKSLSYYMKNKILFENSYIALYSDGTIGISDGIVYIDTMNIDEVNELYMALKLLKNNS